MIHVERVWDRQNQTIVLVVSASMMIVIALLDWRDLGTWNTRPQRGPRTGDIGCEPRPNSAEQFSGSDPDHQPGGASRRRDRYYRILQYRIFRGSQTQRAVAPRVSSEQECTNCGDGSGTRKNTWGDLEFLAAHRRQHGGSGQRNQGRVGDKSFRPRSENARRWRRSEASSLYG